MNGVEVIDARYVVVTLHKTAESLVDALGDDMEDVPGPTLVLSHRLDELGLVITGPVAQLLAIHERIGKALGVVDGEDGPTAVPYSEAKARLEAVWPGGMLACYSDDPAERVPFMTVESALAVLFPPTP